MLATKRGNEKEYMQTDKELSVVLLDFSDTETENDVLNIDKYQGICTH